MDELLDFILLILFLLVYIRSFFLHVFLRQVLLFKSYDTSEENEKIQILPVCTTPSMFLSAQTMPGAY